MDFNKASINELGLHIRANACLFASRFSSELSSRSQQQFPPGVFLPEFHPVFSSQAHLSLELLYFSQQVIIQNFQGAFTAFFYFPEKKGYSYEAMQHLIIKSLIL